MKKLFGGLLLAIGVLIAGVSGLCTLTFLVVGGDYITPSPLIIGGISFALGFSLFLVGRALLRSSQNNLPEE